MRRRRSALLVIVLGLGTAPVACSLASLDGFNVDSADSSTENSDGSDASAADQASDTAPDTSTTGDAAESGTVQACLGLSGCERRVFVTRATFNGNLGGAAGADAKCQAAADVSKLSSVIGRTYRAWIASDSTFPDIRLPHGTSAYRRTDDAIVADDWTQLVTKTHRVPILLDENGNTVDTVDVWTGANDDGTQAGTGHFCGGTWTSSVGVTGWIGGAHLSGAGWSNRAVSPSCTGVARLYCFEY